MDSDRLEAEYRVEYAPSGPKPLGFTLNSVLFHHQYPTVNALQEYESRLPWRGWQARSGIFTRTSELGYLGLEFGAERVDAGPLAPVQSRQFLAMRYDLDGRDRVVVPTHGRRVRLEGDLSTGGLSYRRGQFILDESWPLHQRREGTLSASLALGGIGGGAPFYARYNPGGWRDAYGFITYGLAANNYALATGSYRMALLDLGPIRFYGETGVSAARTADRFAGLRQSGNRYGAGASLIALNDWIGPITFLDPEEGRLTEATIEGQIHRPWDLWKRKIARKG